MIYILETLSSIKVGNLYPVPSDMNSSAMLARIRYIRNETTRICGEKLPECMFYQYWDDIAQVKLSQMYSFLYLLASKHLAEHKCFYSYSNLL